MVVERSRQGAASAEGTVDRVKADVVYDAGNELWILRAAIASEHERARVVRAMRSSQFLAPGNAPIFEALKRFVAQKLDFDADLLERFVREEGGDVEGSYLRELIRSAAVPENLEWRLETLAWDSTRANVLQGPLQELVEALADPKAEADAVAARARGVARALESKSGRRAIRRGADLQRSYNADFRTRIAAPKIWRFGFEPMEEKFTEGVKPGRTTVIAGLSGSGKSTLMAEFLIRQAAMGRTPLYCAWEMPPDSMLDVIASSITNIALTRIVRGHVSEEEADRVERAVSWACEHIRFMDYPFSRRREASEGRYSKKESNDDRQDFLEGYLAESGSNLAVYDLWERMLCDLSYDGVTRALYRQQAMHEEFGIHGVIVHQLRGKDVEKRADKRPTREAIKGVGAFVEVADLIFGIHREGQLKSVPDDTVELICLKQRKGIANWSFRFDWLPETCRIRGGEEVSYDPGLDAADFDSIAGIKSGKKARAARGGRPGRPE